MQTHYFDNQATTPLDPRVFEAMEPFFKHSFGNPHSIEHGRGLMMSSKVELAREQVAQAIGADPREIVFTSGATEANNLAIKGLAGFELAHGKNPTRRKIITFATEHKCVLESAKSLSNQGFSLKILPVQSDGLIDLSDLEKHLDDTTALVSAMMVNNEIGVIQPIAKIAEMAKKVGAKLHCDAAQALGKVGISASDLQVDLMSLSAHKAYGPMGIGALYVRRKPRIRLEPLFHGGSQERALRSGTLPLPLCIGFGKAAELAARDASIEIFDRRKPLDELLQRRPDLYRLNGHSERRVPHNLNISFLNTSRRDMLKRLVGFEVSSGSACSAVDVEPSYVLQALGLAPEEAEASVRISLGRFTTSEQVKALTNALDV